MSEFLTQVMEDISNCGRFIEPRAVLRPGEPVVGECTEFQKKLWTVHQQQLRHVEELKIEMHYGYQKPTPEMQNFLKQAEQRQELLIGLFWESVKARFNLWDQQFIGVREGFKVVKMPETPPHGLRPMTVDMRQVTPEDIGQVIKNIVDNIKEAPQSPEDKEPQTPNV